MKHFADRFIVQKDKIHDNAGVCRVVRRPHPSYTDDAYPSIFPNLSSYLTTPVVPLRKDPNERRAQVHRREEAMVEDFLNDDVITDYSCLVRNINTRIATYLTTWYVRTTDDQTYIFYVDVSPTHPLYVRASICVHSDLRVVIYYDSFQLTTSQLSWILNAACAIERWSQLENLLSHFQNSPSYNNFTKQPQVSELVNRACAILDSIEFADDADDDSSSACIAFCSEQLKLA